MARMIPRFTIAFAVLAAFVVSAPAALAGPESEPVRVMILGAFHFDNPGQDLNNARIDPVTTLEKQEELARVAEGLARFQPTAIALERVAADPATLLDHRYPDFTAADLLTNADERVQIGYRLAAQLGLERVYAVDEQSDTRDYFPFGPVQAWLQANDRFADFERLNAPIAADVADLERRQRVESLGAILASRNDRAHPVDGDGAQALYYGLLRFGDGDDQPGAALNAGWYERNARIFTKLITVARPGDRIVVLFGAGHNYWLRHFVETTPGFELVDPVPYLPAD